MKAIIAIIADALLESVENVLLAAIDVLIELTKGVIHALNATIDIPVISWLYKQVANADLSLMDLTCLIAAIPVTVSYKLIANAAPFPDNATTTALTNAGSFSAIQQIYRPSQQVAAKAPATTPKPAAAIREVAFTTPEPAAMTAEPAAMTAEADVAAPVAEVATPVAAATIPTADNAVLVLTGGIASLIGALSLIVFTPLAKKNPETKVFPVINGLSYLLYVSPDVMGQIPDLQNVEWWAIMNQIIADVMVVKAMVDMGVSLTPTGSKAQGAWNPVSPWLDFGGNILWQVPTTAALFNTENQNASGIVNFWAGTCFDCNGVMSPLVADDSEMVSWLVAVGFASFFNLAYGVMSCASSGLTFASDQKTAVAQAGAAPA